MDNLIGIIFSFVVLIVGFIMVYGAKDGWKFLIDPPESWWLFYSQSFIKKIFGKKFLYYETIVIGGLLIIASLYPWFSIIFIN